jgi:hypothetical protein
MFEMPEHSGRLRGYTKTIKEVAVASAISANKDNLDLMFSDRIALVQI